MWVELGLQTIHKKSAEYIRRCYPLSIYDEAVSNLKKRNLTVIVHVILGLPGESKDDMLATVKYVCDSGIDGIKLQLMHILKGTDLAKDYEKGAFDALSLDEYVSIVVDCLKIIPSNIVIHRMTGDGDKKILIAPEWSMDKKNVLNTLTKAIREA